MSKRRKQGPKKSDLVTHYVRTWKGQTYLHAFVDADHEWTQCRSALTRDEAKKLIQKWNALWPETGNYYSLAPDDMWTLSFPGFENKA